MNTPNQITSQQEIAHAENSEWEHTIDKYFVISTVADWQTILASHILPVW